MVGPRPDGGSTYFLPRIVGVRRALELALTNRVLSAREASEWGLVTRVVADGELMTQAGALAEALYRQSRLEEASNFCRRCAECAASDDFSAQILWRSVSAKIGAHQGEAVQAEVVAREAVDLAARTDALNWHGEALLDLAEVLRLDDRSGEAAAAVEEALRLFTQKGNSAAMRRAGRFCASSGRRAPDYWIGHRTVKWREESGCTTQE